MRRILIWMDGFLVALAGAVVFVAIFAGLIYFSNCATSGCWLGWFIDGYRPGRGKLDMALYGVLFYASIVLIAMVLFNAAWRFGANRWVMAVVAPFSMASLLYLIWKMLMFVKTFALVMLPPT